MVGYTSSRLPEIARTERAPSSAVGLCQLFVGGTESDCVSRRIVAPHFPAARVRLPLADTAKAHVSYFESIVI